MKYVDLVRKTAAIALALGLAAGATSAFARPSDEQIVPTGPKPVSQTHGTESEQAKTARHIVEIGGKVGRVHLQDVAQ